MAGAKVRQTQKFILIRITERNRCFTEMLLFLLPHNNQLFGSNNQYFQYLCVH